MQIKISKLYSILLKKYGAPKDFWQIWCKAKKTKNEKEKVILGAILTQRTNWRNVEMALANLEKAGCLSIEKICSLAKNDIKKLEKLIRTAGFYKQKAKRLFGLCEFLKKQGGLENFFKKDALVCRRELMELSGIGPETADSILLYAGAKPIFVIDEYTKRFCKKHSLTRNFSYDHLQQLFQQNLPKNIKVYRDFHAMIVLEGKETSWDLVSKT